MENGESLIVLIILVAFGVCIPISATATYPEFHGHSRTPSQGPGVANHPVGVRPNAEMKIPNGWPLAADGSLTCLTCHSTLAKGANGSHQLRGDKNNGDPRAFCMNCHQVSGTGTAVHWQAMDVAHVSQKHNREGANRNSVLAGSESCLSCHDGVSANDPGHNLGRSTAGLGDRSRNHPVGVAYPLSGNMRAEVPLRPASSVPETVSLAGGVVSCVSCHNLYASDAQRLSVPIDGSQLCLACHDLD